MYSVRDVHLYSSMTHLARNFWQGASWKNMRILSTVMVSFGFFAPRPGPPPPPPPLLLTGSISGPTTALLAPRQGNTGPGKRSKGRWTCAPRSLNMYV
jgi:hypothetical protein